MTGHKYAKQVIWCQLFKRCTYKTETFLFVHLLFLERSPCLLNLQNVSKFSGDQQVLLLQLSKYAQQKNDLFHQLTAITLFHLCRPFSYPLLKLVRLLYFVNDLKISN
jgi:hypothetical protein